MGWMMGGCLLGLGGRVVFQGDPQSLGEVNIAKSDQVVLDGWVDCMLEGWLALILFCLLEVVLLMSGQHFAGYETVMHRGSFK